MSAPRAFRDALLAVSGIALVVMMVAIDQTVVSTALPTIVADLAGFDMYAWVATTYMLMSIITIPIFGRLGDYYGRKPFVVAAIVLFTAASVACAFAGSMLFLVFGRALQGIGGGMLIGTAFASIPDLFPDPYVRLRWQVVVSSSFGAANAVGPSLGGFLADAYGWRSVFYVNVPIGLLCLYVVARYLPHIRHMERGAARIDWPGAALIAVTLATLQLLVQLAPRQGLSINVIALGCVSIAALSALVWRERRCEQPLLPLALFSHPMVGSLAVLAVLTGLSMFTMLFYVPLMLQGGFALSAHDAGLLVTPLVVCITVGSIINGRLVTRIPRPNVMLYCGFSLLAMAFSGIALTHSSTPHPLIVVFMVMGGVGLGFIMPNLTIFAQEAVDRSQLGIVTALLQSVRMIGGMIGTGAVGALVTELYAGGIHTLAATENAVRFEAELSDPQVLMSAASADRFIGDSAAIGLDGAALLDRARTVLVSAIHYSQWAGIAAAMVALWRVRAVPRVVFSKQRT